MYLNKLIYRREFIPSPEDYPFSIPAFQTLEELELPTNITFFVGENGAGKSTLLEAMANVAGFNAAGGGKQHTFSIHAEEAELSPYIRLSWRKKVHEGFFLRAESFYQFASYIDHIEDPRKYSRYGDKSLHEASHGESFMRLFQNAFGKQAIYFLDEPEAALSPTRQLSLLRIMKELEPTSQFVIATHSPILLGYPGATIYSFDDRSIAPISYEETDHYQVTKLFLDNPERMLRELFQDLDT